MPDPPLSPVLLDYAAGALPRWAEFLLAPIGRPFYAFLAAASLWILWAARDPGSFFARFLCTVLLLSFAGYWLARRSLRHRLCRTYRLPSSLLVGHRRPIYAVLAVAILLILALSLDLPVRLAFRVSEPAMRRKAQAMIAASPPSAFFASAPDEWVGLYHFDSITYMPESHAVFFFLRDGSIFADGGWTYAPDATPVGPIGEGGPAIQTHLDGPWYRTLLPW